MAVLFLNWHCFNGLTSQSWSHNKYSNWLVFCLLRTRSLRSKQTFTVRGRCYKRNIEKCTKVLFKSAWRGDCWNCSACGSLVFICFWCSVESMVRICATIIRNAIIRIYSFSSWFGVNTVKTCIDAICRILWLRNSFVVCKLTNWKLRKLELRKLPAYELEAYTGSLVSNISESFGP